MRVHAELVKQPIAANVFRSETEVLEGAGAGNLARVDFRDSGQPFVCTDKLADSNLVHPRSHLPQWPFIQSSFRFLQRLTGIVNGISETTDTLDDFSYEVLRDV